MGLAVGVAAGAAAALLAAPMRGADMRASLRSRADGAVDRAMALLQEGRRAFRTRGSLDHPSSATASAETTFSATLGEIAQMHDGSDVSTLGARS
jgi:gas vesicle protein